MIYQFAIYDLPVVTYDMRNYLWSTQFATYAIFFEKRFYQLKEVFFGILGVLRFCPICYLWSTYLLLMIYLTLRSAERNVFSSYLWATNWLFMIYPFYYPFFPFILFLLVPLIFLPFFLVFFSLLSLVASAWLLRVKATKERMKGKKANQNNKRKKEGEQRKEKNQENKERKNKKEAKGRRTHDFCLSVSLFVTNLSPKMPQNLENIFVCFCVLFPCLFMAGVGCAGPTTKTHKPPKHQKKTKTQENTTKT